MYRSLKTALFLVLLPVTLSAEICVQGWQQEINEDNHKPEISFGLAPHAMFDAFAEKNDDKASALIEKISASDQWMFKVTLKGKPSTRYTKETIELWSPIAGPCGGTIEVQSGDVELNSQKNTVKVRLKIIVEGEVKPFQGNGTFHIPNPLNPSPQPTSG